MSIVLGVLIPHPPLIVPAVGRGQERNIEATVRACQQAATRIREAKPDVLIVISPHATTYQDYFVVSGGDGADGSFSSFGAMQTTMRVKYHKEFVRELARIAGTMDIPAGTMGEKAVRLDHGTMVPLWFLRDLIDTVPIVRTGLSGCSPLEHYRFGTAIKAAAEAMNVRTVVLASGDLSHKLTADGPYGYAPEGPKFDEIVAAALSHGDFKTILTLNDAMCEEAAECGLRSIQILAGALDGQAVDATLLSHEGPFGVGYAVATFVPKGSDEQRRFDQVLRREEEANIREAALHASNPVRLARASIEAYVNGRKRLSTVGMASDLKNRRAGAFVSIHKEGRLRGCIGTIAATQSSLADEIVANAIAACSRDPRFDPIRPDELPYLEISVDVLGEASSCEKEDLDPKRYGVIVRRGGRTGLLLPNLEGVDTIAKQLSIALSKAGIDESEEYAIERFEVVRYH